MNDAERYQKIRDLLTAEEVGFFDVAADLLEGFREGTIDEIVGEVDMKYVAAAEMMFHFIANEPEGASKDAGEHLYYSVRMGDADTSETADLQHAVEKARNWREKYPERTVDLVDVRAFKIEV